LVATPGSKAYGRLSVLIRWLYEPVILFDIDARAFTPPPKVTSTLIGLTPHPQPSHAADRAVLERLTGAAFGQRRKMLRSSLKTLGPSPLAALEEAGISPEARGETLDVEQFCALARAYAATIPAGA
ncbi:MAG: ribosomal RNA small subunit methyltransferase A, partial [Alphaproteobacteria bacterium]